MHYAGPYHCWFNKFEGTKNLFKKDGIFLVLSGHFLGSSLSNGLETVILIEKIKLLQQRFPQLHIMGFQSGGSACSAADRSNLIQLIMKENITFPILLSNKNFSEVANGACSILFKNFRKPVFFREKDLNFEVIEKAVEELQREHNGNARSPNNLFTISPKRDEIIKKPNLCSMRNLLFYFPGCISADESGDRLFISDSNHHRIIVSNGNGKILDCIGSSPGFEDGEFESAKLMCPAASFYHEDENCLYFVDSENHAIRRADMGRRVLETFCPACNTGKKSFWTWIMEKLGLRSNVDTKPEEFDIQSLMFPWHLIKSAGDNLLVINRSFQTLWIINLAIGEIEEVVEGLSKILETYGEHILEKVGLLKQMPYDWLQQQANAACSPDELPNAGLISSLTTFNDHLIICDMVGQRVLKLSGESKVCSNLQFSKFGILGLPYWLSPHLERAYTGTDGLQGPQIDHLQCFSLLPGKISIQLNVNIPVDTQLVEQLQEGSIWCQARGVAAIVSEVKDLAGSPDKVGSAQKWYDELDNLAFTTPEPELTEEDEDITSDTIFQDEKVHITTAVNTSPGNSEVIINAVLYLKLRRDLDQLEENQEKYAARIVDILNSGRSGKVERESCIKFLLKANRDLRDLIFMRPLHVRMKVDSFDHPKDDNSRDSILTESSIEVNVSL
ncbi:uncharacterized protein LOC21398315 [Morus notabilis]|uniref:uncharacterized protein LOC21398315 n=1 Tax=Morus notabilis TaxID=981085 RepID=UPI000CED3B46|nr:uncharacterized protein LOC21398315 [Morus notabilis]